MEGAVAREDSNGGARDVPAIERTRAARLVAGLAARLLVGLVTCFGPLRCLGEVPGRDLFEAYCSGCHGAEAEGVNAPDITGMPRKIVARAVQGVEQMPEIALTEAEIDAIAAFLAMLGTSP